MSDDIENVGIDTITSPLTMRLFGLPGIVTLTSTGWYSESAPNMDGNLTNVPAKISTLDEITVFHGYPSFQIKYDNLDQFRI